MDEKVFVQRGKPLDKDGLDQLRLYASMRKNNSKESLKKAAIIYDSDPITQSDYMMMALLKESGLFDRLVNKGKRG